MKLTKEDIRKVVELFLVWNGSEYSIDVANIDSAINFIEECLDAEATTESNPL